MYFRIEEKQSTVLETSEFEQLALNWIIYFHNTYESISEVYPYTHAPQINLKLDLQTVSRKTV
jgi:hypothetical protein